MTKEQLIEELMCVKMTLRAAQAWILMDEGALPSRDDVVLNLARMLRAGDHRLYALMDEDEAKWLLEQLGQKVRCADACE